MKGRICTELRDCHNNYHHIHFQSIYHIDLQESIFAIPKYSSYLHHVYLHPFILFWHMYYYIEVPSIAHGIFFINPKFEKKNILILKKNILIFEKKAFLLVYTTHKVLWVHCKNIQPIWSIRLDNLSLF